MAKIDRLGWAGGLIFTSHGSRIGIRIKAPGPLPRLPILLPPRSRSARSLSPVVDALYSVVLGGPQRSPGVRSYNLLYWGSTRVSRALDALEVWRSLEASLHFTVALFARRRLFLHAGVVGWRGRAVLLPGRSQAGKSRLVEALVKSGATYYSDEYAVLDEQGLVYPYAKPLYLRGDSGEGRRHVTTTELGGLVGREPLPVGLIVLTEYHCGRQWRPRLISPAEALFDLMNHNVHARLRSAPALGTLKAIVLRAPALKGGRGEAADMIKALLTRLESACDTPSANVS